MLCRVELCAGRVELTGERSHAGFAEAGLGSRVCELSRSLGNRLQCLGNIASADIYLCDLVCHCLRTAGRNCFQLIRKRTGDKSGINNRPGGCIPSTQLRSHLDLYCKRICSRIKNRLLTYLNTCIAVRNLD